MKNLIVLMTCLFVSLSASANKVPITEVDYKVLIDINQILIARDAVYKKYPWAKNRSYSVQYYIDKNFATFNFIQHKENLINRSEAIPESPPIIAKFHMPNMKLVSIKIDKSLSVD